MPAPVELTLPKEETFNRAFPAEWSRICKGRHNVLLEGSLVFTSAALFDLRPYLGSAVFWQRPGRRLEHECWRAETIVLPDVAVLDPEDQARLMVWMDESHSRWVVSASIRPLFRFVERGLFDETLYYRLNVVMLRLGRRRAA